MPNLEELKNILPRLAEFGIGAVPGAAIGGLSGQAKYNRDVYNWKRKGKHGEKPKNKALKRAIVGGALGGAGAVGFGALGQKGYELSENKARRLRDRIIADAEEHFTDLNKRKIKAIRNDEFFSGAGMNIDAINTRSNQRKGYIDEIYNGTGLSRYFENLHPDEYDTMDTAAKVRKKIFGAGRTKSNSSVSDILTHFDDKVEKKINKDFEKEFEDAWARRDAKREQERAWRRQKDKEEWEDTWKKYQQQRDAKREQERAWRRQKDKEWEDTWKKYQQQSGGSGSGKGSSQDYDYSNFWKGFGGTGEDKMKQKVRDLLGVELSDIKTKADLKKAYKKAALKWHPDVNKSSDATEMMKKINVLIDDKYWDKLAAWENEYIEKVAYYKEVIYNMAKK
jgi:hypothetical protein